MPVTPAYRKRIKHYDTPGHVHELTFSCYRRQPLLDSDIFRAMLSTAVDRAMNDHASELLGFVYMPEHVHLLVYPLSSTPSISKLLYAIKRPYSYRVKQWMTDHNDRRMTKLTIRERPGKESFRFWQEGPGYDRNIDSPRTLRSTLDYIHSNPVRRGLCSTPEQWKWSSWHHYHVRVIPEDLPRVNPRQTADLLQ